MQFGVLLDLWLLLDEEMSAILRRGFAQTHLVQQLCPFLDGRFFLQSLALVTSQLGYRNILYTGLPLKTTWKLYLLQNEAVHIVLSTLQLAHVASLLCKLYWFPAVFWVQFKALVITFKALQGTGSDY